MRGIHSGPFARWLSLKSSTRVRVAGIVVLVFGILSSGILYWDRTRSVAPTIDELMPGYSSNRDRQVAILIGTLGSMAVNGLDNLKEPGTQALLIVAASALVTIVCFRVAWVLDLPEPDTPPPRK